MDFARRKLLYSQCDPFEALEPSDPRYLDVDAMASKPRGPDVVSALASRLELTSGPEVAFFTGLPGSGKSTELRRLAQRLSDPQRANALVVWVNAEEWFELNSEVDIVDLLAILLAEANVSISHATNGDRLLSSLTWLFDYQLEGWLLEAASKKHSLGLVARTLRAHPSAWQQFRERWSTNQGEFLTRICDEFATTEELAKTLGKNGVIFLFDSLEKLHGPRRNGQNVLDSLERALHALRSIPNRPGPIVLTIPPALAFRMRLDNLHLLPMLGRRHPIGGLSTVDFDACRALVNRRLSSEDLLSIFGEDTEEALLRITEISGGNPKEIVRLLRSSLVGTAEGNTLSIGRLERIIADWQEAYRRALDTESTDWLARLSQEKQLPLQSPKDRATAEKALSNGLVVHYYAPKGWFDVHPAIKGMLSEQAPSNKPDTDPPKSPPRSPESHALTHIELTNIGPFASLPIDLRPGWNVLLGDNGTGKTSVLRAVALALAGRDPRAAVGGQRLLRSGENSGSVTLNTERSSFTTTLQRLPTDVRVTASAETLTTQGRWLTLGFPPIRGLSARIISGPTAVAPPIAGAHDLLPLIDGNADPRLDDSRQWIVNTALRADGNEAPEIKARHRRLLDRWFSILVKLMPGLHFVYDRVDRDSWQVLVKTADGVLPIEQLSQGMVSTIGWIGTLLRRLYEAYPDSEEPEKEPALVLLDEIDAHLHPSWQRRIVPLVREQFPRVQVLATTHSPLIVGNLAPDEILLFRRDDSEQLKAERVVDHLQGYRVDQVLTSDAFGLPTTRSEYAIKLLEDYADALSHENEGPEARARLAELTARVRREIPSPPETIKEREDWDKAVREADEAIRARLSTATSKELDELEALVRSRGVQGETR